MEISITDARALFTKKVIAVYLQQVEVKSFLRSFFKVDESTSKLVSIAVRRGFEKVAVDVLRGTEGNRNTFSRSTEKAILPPLYWEFLTANENSLYDVAISSQTANVFAELAKQLGVDLFQLKQKIDRAIELQCAQVLETGIVQLKNGTNIDYKRSAWSLVDGSATPWTNDTYNPLFHIEDMCKGIRQKGKSQGSIFNVIMGSDAKRAFDNNKNIKDQGLMIRINHLDIAMPQRNSVGGTTHGQFAAGDYTCILWTYPEYYDNAAGVSTPYINPKKVIVLPEDPDFVLAYAAVPQLINKDGSIPQQGAYLVSDHIDEKAASHEIHIKSAPVAVPVAVDQMATRQVIA